MKKTIIAISVITIVFIITTIIVSLNILKNNNISTDISIISLSNVTTKYHLVFEKVKKATKYEVNVYSEDNKVFYTQKTTSSDLFLDLDKIEYNKKYRLIIYAYNINGENIASSRSYDFVYNEPTFSKDNEILLTNNQDYIVSIDGNLNKKNYYIAICDGDYIIKKDKLTDNKYAISSKIFTGLKQSFTINLYDNNTVINSYKVYSNISPVSNIKIENLKDGVTLPYEDFALKYSGGNNATSYVLQIFKENTIIKEIKINNSTIIISKDFFKKGEKYTIRVRALYNDISEYAKSDSIEITISTKDNLYPPFIDIYPIYYKENSDIKLINPNNSGKIYYTLDDKDPITDGIEFKDNIKLSQDTIIKAIVKNKNSISNISYFNVKVNSKEKYSVYLNGNGALINYIEKKLSDKGVVVYLYDNKDNTPVISDAKFKNSDLYLSINTEEKQSIGYNIWINNSETLSYNLANMINDKLKETYNTQGNVKYAEGFLEELDDNIPLSMVINFTYSDSLNVYPDDYTKIGDDIVNQIFNYFGIN